MKWLLKSKIIQESLQLRPSEFLLKWLPWSESGWSCVAESMILKFAMKALLYETRHPPPLIRNYWSKGKFSSNTQRIDLLIYSMTASDFHFIRFRTFSLLIHLILPLINMQQVDNTSHRGTHEFSSPSLTPISIFLKTPKKVIASILWVLGMDWSFPQQSIDPHCCCQQLDLETDSNLPRMPSRFLITIQTSILPSTEFIHIKIAGMGKKGEE